MIDAQTAIVRRAACDEWPKILNPAPGCMPPEADIAGDERVLHVALRAPSDPQNGLTTALRSIGTAYADVDWRRSSWGTDAEIISAARYLKPTLVWMQLQAPNVVAPATINELRGIAPKNCVVINWDGDQHYEAGSPYRRWFVELGRVCDASLVVNTQHPLNYYGMGVVRPGFLEVGTDEEIWRPVDPWDNVKANIPDIVCLANYWNFSAYEKRNTYFQMLTGYLGNNFAVYGKGWGRNGDINNRPYLENHEECHIYNAAKGALSISIRNNLPRYTSNRLFYALSSGAIVLVERFPDCEGLGLIDGKNCLIWEGWDQLRATVDELLTTYESNRQHWHTMRMKAHALGCLHSWKARMRELMAIVYAVRQDRGY